MIYKMPYPVWQKIAYSIPLINGGYIDEKGIIKYLENDCGLVDTGVWECPDRDEFDDWDEDKELYHYRVTNKKKYAVFLLKWG